MAHCCVWVHSIRPSVDLTMVNKQRCSVSRLGPYRAIGLPKHVAPTVSEHILLWHVWRVNLCNKRLVNCMNPPLVIVSSENFRQSKF